MSKTEKFLFFTNTTTLLVLLILIGLLILEKTNNETENTEINKCVEVEENKNVDNEAEKETNCNDSIKVDGHLVYSDSTENNKIYLMSNNTLELISKDLGNKVIAENVVKTYDISAGQSDICDGNRWIVANTEDNKFIAISIDSMTCGNEFELLDVSSKLSKMKLDNTMSIYTTEKFTNQFEPTITQVYALSEDGISTEITNIFE